MRFTTFVLIFIMGILQPTSLVSQSLTLEDLMPGGKTYRKFTPSFPTNLSWLGDQLIYQKGDSILKISTKTNKDDGILFTRDEINNLLGSSEKIPNLNNVVATREGQILISGNNQITIIDPDKKEVFASYLVNPEMNNIELSPSGELLAYTKGNNLYVKNKDGIEKTITYDNNKRIINGQSVHQNEFGIKKGTFWSPDSRYLAFYRMDESMVDAYPLVDTDKRIAQEIDKIYPMAGRKSHHVRLGIYNTETGDTIFLKTGLPKEKYLTNISWNPESNEIYIAELNRGQDSLQLNVYNIHTGKKIKTLFTEENSKYVEPENPIVFLNKNSKQFIWQSRRDGYNHLYLFDTDGKIIKQLTNGNYDILEFLGMNDKGSEVFYLCNENDPLQQKYFKLDLKTGKKQELTSEEGVHSASLSKSGEYILDWYSSISNPRSINIISTKNNKSQIYHQAKNPYDGYEMPEIRLGKIKADDDKTDLFYRMVLPTDFDPTKKYPVIVYVYGGPHSQLVTNTWLGGARGWDIYMAQKGFIVFTLDNRGTSNRGNDFEQVTHRHLGVIETHDQMKGIEFLSSLPYTDMDKVGVHGWSFGGFMTLNLMLRHSEVFKVGVAGGPVVDWKYYEIMYGERYMDHPKENPEGYEETSMLNYIGNLDGRLLLIHGDMDPVVLMQHTSQLLRAAVKERVHPDLFIYPGHEHNVLGKDRVHLYEHVTRYFDDFLK